MQEIKKANAGIQCNVTLTNTKLHNNSQSWQNKWTDLRLRANMNELCDSSRKQPSRRQGAKKEQGKKLK